LVRPTGPEAGRAGPAAGVAEVMDGAMCGRDALVTNVIPCMSLTQVLALAAKL
jgi:hypothetical protein